MQMCEVAMLDVHEGNVNGYTKYLIRSKTFRSTTKKDPSV
jgi:hypothetical protein